MFLFRQHQPAPYPKPEELLIQPQVDTWVKRRDAHCFEIGWTIEAEVVTIFAGCQPEAIERDRPLATVKGEQKVVLSDDGLAARPYFELALAGGPMAGQRIVVAERTVPFQGIFNFRDLGGYRTTDGQRVRWGRVYRTGDLFGLTQTDQKLLQQLGPKLICDLRTDSEVVDRPNTLPKALMTTYRHIPVYRRDRTLRALAAIIFRRHQLDQVFQEWYVRVLEEKAHVLGTLLRHIANAKNLPIIVHCTAGKDRTGIISALLLLLLGVPEKTVIADYTLSNLYFEVLQQEVSRNFHPIARLRIDVDELQPLLVADPQNLKVIIDYCRKKHGSVESYVHSAAGVDGQVVAQLKANLLVSG